MKLVMTLPVRNEEDILDICLGYHLERGVDHIIAMNNLSIDNSLEILKEYESQGVLTLIENTDDSYNQHLWVEKMTALAVDMGADWIIHNDADEFWWPKRGSIKRLLKEVPGSRAVAVAERWDFVSVAKLPWLITHIYRDLDSLNVLGRRILPKVCQRANTKIKMKHGNHRALLEKEILIPHKLDAEVLHFPIRGYEQIEKKVKIGGAAYGRNPKLWPKTPLLELHRLYKEGKLPEHFEQQLLSSENNQKRLQNGTIVKDTRLLEFMKRPYYQLD